MRLLSPRQALAIKLLCMNKRLSSAVHLLVNCVLCILSLFLSTMLAKIVSALTVLVFDSLAEHSGECTSAQYIVGQLASTKAVCCLLSSS